MVLMQSITCAISKLPILEGEEMVCLPLIMANTYRLKNLQGRIETKGMSIHVYDAFKQFSLVIKGTKGVADSEKPFSKIYKDDNTKSLENYYNLPIEDFVDILIQNHNSESIYKPKNINGLDLAMTIGIFIKRSIFDYVVTHDVEDSWDGSVRNVFEERYDDLQKAIKEWESIKSKNEMNEYEQYRAKENPFGSYGSYNHRIFSDSLLDERMKEIYESALLNNSIREHFVETFTFVSRCNSVLTHLFLPTMKGEAKDSIHEQLSALEISILEKKLQDIKKDYEYEYDYDYEDE